MSTLPTLPTYIADTADAASQAVNAAENYDLAVHGWASAVASGTRQQWLASVKVADANTIALLARVGIKANPSESTLGFQYHAARIVGAIPTSSVEDMSAADVASLFPLIRSAMSKHGMKASDAKRLAVLVGESVSVADAASLIRKATRPARSADKDTDKADKGDGADKGNAARSQDALVADAMAIVARLDKAHLETFLVNVKASQTASTVAA